MATAKQCETALRTLAAQLGDVDPETRDRHALARTLACEVTDLDVTFRGELRDGELRDIVRGDANGAQLTLRVTSDDLIALTRSELNFAMAWATGRLKIDASLGDLLKLRSLL